MTVKSRSVEGSPPNPPSRLCPGGTDGYISAAVLCDLCPLFASLSTAFHEFYSPGMQSPDCVETLLGGLLFEK